MLLCFVRAAITLPIVIQQGDTHFSFGNFAHFSRLTHKRSVGRIIIYFELLKCYFLFDFFFLYPLIELFAMGAGNTPEVNEGLFVERNQRKGTASTQCRSRVSNPNTYQKNKNADGNFFFSHVLIIQHISTVTTRRG